MNIKLSFLIGLCVTLVSVAVGSEISETLRVVWSADPQHEAVIVWDGDEADESSVVLYGTAAGKLSSKAPVTEAGLYTEAVQSGTKKKKPSAPSPELFYHHAKLSNLQPDTIYYLAVKNAEGTGREYHFRTAPKDEKAFKMAYAGDSRTHIEVAKGIGTQLRKMIEKDDSIIALLHGGDYANTPRRDLWKEWLEAYALSTTKDGKLLPIIPVIGNHDVIGKSPIFRQAYGYPGGQHDYYTCQLTPSVSILCLNTEISTEGDQKNFLQQELKRLDTKEIQWRIAAFHKPAFPAVKQPSGAKVSWVPLFEQFNIDLVLESDGHCIKRTVPIRDGKEADDGVVYLGEGGYGAPQRDPKPDRWYLQGDRAFASKGDHFMLLEITPSTINYEAILNSGKVIDSASFEARP